MTPEELQEKKDRLEKLKRLQQLKALRDRKASMDAAEQPKPDGSSNYTRGVAQQVARGTLSGFGDELVGAARAGIDRLLPNATYDFGGDVRGDERTGSPDYEMYRDDERRSMDAFEQDNQGVALAANLAGSLANPLNRVAPSIGATGGFGARTAAATGRGAAEGALTGFGEGRGDIESQLRSAGEGAKFGAGASALMSGGLGGLGRLASKRRINARLQQQDGTFKPANLAGPETGLGNFYRNTVARSYGGGKIAKQQKEFIEAAKSSVDNLEAQANRQLENIDDSFKAAKREVADIDQSVADVKTAAELQAEKLKSVAANNASKIDDDFMSYAARESLPAHAQDALSGVDVRSGDEMRDAINTWWNKNGFQEVKTRPFRWDAGLKKSIQNDLDADPVLKNAVGGSLQEIDSMKARLMGQGIDPDSLSPEEFYDALMAGNVSGNIVDAAGNPLMKATASEDIPGDVLMELRNSFARASNRGSGVNAGATRRIANRFDQMIRGQLDDEARAQFDDQIERWSTSKAFSDATRLKGPQMNYGRFGVEDFQGPAMKMGGKGTSLKKPVLQKDMRKAYEAKQKALDVKGPIDKLRKSSAKQQKEVRRNAKLQIEKLEDAKTAARRKIKQDKKTGKIGVAKERLAELNRNKASGQANLLTTAALGAGVAPWSLLGVLPAGVGAAATLSTKTGQKALAGQLGPQRALAQSIRKGKTAPYTRAVGRTAALVGEEEEEY